MIDKLGLIPGFSLDLSVNDPEDNEPWDFNRQDKTRERRQII